MSAVGTTLLQSPGCNEGKARYETLGIHKRKVISSSVGAALTEQVLALRWGRHFRDVRQKDNHECVVLATVSTRKHFSKYTYLFQ